MALTLGANAVVVTRGHCRSRSDATKCGVLSGSIAIITNLPGAVLNLISFQDLSCDIKLSHFNLPEYRLSIPLKEIF